MVKQLMFVAVPPPPVLRSVLSSERIGCASLQFGGLSLEFI
uniref:Uncharacterized protein n=1 Tax=Anguilla anguilla TaxID=7936 RepID=A0A0E9RSR3_ANGAN